MTGARPAVIVVAYGRPDLLNAALTPLRGSYDLLVVDNSRSDAIREVARHSGAQYDRPPSNLGFASGVNRGLTTLVGRDVLLLNPDAVLSASALEVLASRLRSQSDLGAVAPRLRRPDGVEERSVWPMPTPWLPWRGAAGLGARSGGRTFLNGAVLLLRAEAVADVGLFDERFFLYAEESDWQQRAQRAGWRVQLVNEVHAEHVGAAMSASSELRDIFFHSSAELFIRKWHGNYGWRLFCAGSVAAALRRSLVPGLRDAESRRRQLRAMRLYVRGPSSALPDWSRR